MTGFCFFFFPSFQLPITGLELRISGVKNNRSTTALHLHVLITTYLRGLGSESLTQLS